MAGDPLWYYKVLGLHCDGTNGSTTFTDVKGNPVTAVGDSKISTAQYPALTGKFSSAYFDGVGDALTVPNSTSLYLGASDFTIRMWYRPDSPLGYARLYSHGEIGGTNWPILELHVEDTGILMLALGYQNANTMTYFSSAAGAVTAAVWNHIEVVRFGTTIKGFVNGTQVFSGTWNNTIWNSGEVVRIGAFLNGGSLVQVAKGYISEVEVYKGAALHTADFTPPTGPFAEEYVFVSGTTKDENGALASRLVRVYRRDTGALVSSVLSNGVTGAYKVIAPDSGTPTPVNLTVVCLDATADPPGTPTENAIIYDNITPA